MPLFKTGNQQSCTSGILTQRKQKAGWAFCFEPTCVIVKGTETRHCLVWCPIIGLACRGMVFGKSSLVRCWSTDWLWPGSWSRWATVDELTSNNRVVVHLLSSGWLWTRIGQFRALLKAANDGERRCVLAVSLLGTWTNNKLTFLVFQSYSR